MEIHCECEIRGNGPIFQHHKWRAVGSEIQIHILVRIHLFELREKLPHTDIDYTTTKDHIFETQSRRLFKDYPLSLGMVLKRVQFLLRLRFH